jgi:two-component system CheB/CheR fusion protein
MQDQDQGQQNHPLPVDTIVAIGASAGGLEALDRFFSAIDPDLPIAFVVIQHLAPTHRTMMDSLLGRHTAMTVQVAAEGDVLRAGHVYVIPSGVMMTLVDRRLHFNPRPAQGVMHPINDFFHSLATSGCDRMIGVVLSGTGSDGSEGLHSIVEAGGWALVQSPASASFDGMPLNALATGLAHECDTPENLAHIIEGILREDRHPALLRKDGVEDVSPAEALERVGPRIGINISSYKPHTMLRRLERRVQATGNSTLRDYLVKLETDDAEPEKLRREMLISVTSFFRDRESFEELAQKIIKPDLLQRMNAPKPRYRIWSVGCSTGQEAYSLAILVFEAMREIGVEAEIKIFASDIESSYLSVASAGRYPARLMQNIPADLRDRYFNHLDNGDYQVTPRLRRAIVFSQHDVLNDPPFLHLDLVVCRNMIIYLKPEAQERALRRMMFGLEHGAAMLMGSSEAPGKLGKLLETVSAQSKLYRMRGQLRHLTSDDILITPAHRKTVTDRRRIVPSALPPLEDALQSLSPAANCLLQAYVPPSVIVDANREIRHVFGDIVPYLHLRAGSATLDLTLLLPDRIGAVVSTLIFSALRDNSGKSIIVHPEDDPDFGLEAPVQIRIRPIPGHTPGQPTHLAVSFERLGTTVGSIGLPAQDEGITDLTARRAAELETELERVRATLKSTIEELGSANEELQASNEELMASNEELQSTNEELQSVNEELHTVNTELQEKIIQLNEAYADLEGLSRAARIPMVFLDGATRITRYTAQATEIFRLREQDIGRPLMDITHSLTLPDLEDRIVEALTRQQTVQQEARDRAGRSWLVTIQPFVGRSSEESRIVLSFIDVSSIEAMRFLQSVIDAAPQNMAVLDAAGHIRMVNRAWRAFAEDNGGSEFLANGLNLNYMAMLEKAAATDRIARKAHDGLADILQGRATQTSMIYPCHSATQKRWFLMHAATLSDGGCVVTHLDITHLNLPKVPGAEG